VKNNGNIILHQIYDMDDNFVIKEIIPYNAVLSDLAVLAKKDDTSIYWQNIDLSLNIVIDNKFKDTSIYYIDGKIGLGRSPLFTYTFDIAVPKNTITTAFHIGDGSYGFSMGNGTSNGFIPEIIGVGSNETDVGLYLIGIAGNNKSSNVPLVLVDGRDKYSRKLKNRPIFGITSNDYNNYGLLIDASYNLNINGNIYTHDIILDNISLRNLIQTLQDQINQLQQK